MAPRLRPVVAPPHPVRRTALTQAGAPTVEWLEAPAESSAKGPPVLFLHGAFGAAWMWEENFMPAFAAAGRRSFAVSLRGHGGSEGLEALRTWSLRDFLADAERALRELPEPPVVVAHSLGGLLAQLLIGRTEMRGLVLLASLPPEGLFFEGPRLAMTEPHIWLEAVSGSLAKVAAPIRTAGAELLFSEGLPRERVQRYVSRLQPESPRALVEAHMPGLIQSALVRRLPTLVVGGNRDRLVTRSSTFRTAVYHGAEHQILQGAGHFLQLDCEANEVARRVLAWIESRVPVG